MSRQYFYAFDCDKRKISKYIDYYQSNDWIVIHYRLEANPCDPFSFDTYSAELIDILEQWDKLYKDSSVNEITMLYKDGDITLTGNGS